MAYQKLGRFSPNILTGVSGLFVLSLIITYFLFSSSTNKFGASHSAGEELSDKELHSNLNGNWRGYVSNGEVRQKQNIEISLIIDAYSIIQGRAHISNMNCPGSGHFTVVGRVVGAQILLVFTGDHAACGKIEAQYKMFRYDTGALHLHAEYQRYPGNFSGRHHLEKG